MSTETILNVLNLQHRFRTGAGLEDISFQARAGERIALLGHNGAGKSTLMKAVIGLLPFDRGEVSVCGHAPGSASARKATAYLPEAVAFHPKLTGREQLKLFARLAGAPRTSVGELLEKVGLAKAADQRIGTYSKGMRQRLGMAQVFLGRPKLALLDEPTSGLDPVARHDLYALVDALAEQGTAVLMASHALTEIDAQTDRVIILRSGMLVADGALETLTRNAAMPIRFRLQARDDAAVLFERFGGQRINGARVEFACPPEAKMATLGEIAALGDAVSDLEILPPTLDDLYRFYAQDEETSR